MNTAFIDASAWIAYEALSILKSRASYEAAKSLWDILCDSELSRNVYIDRTLEDKSVELFWKYQDKNWGIVDCSSVLLMEQEKCGVAFGYDHHFVQAAKQYAFTVL